MWVSIAVILVVLAVLDGAQLSATIQFVLQALLSTAPYIAFAVIAIGYLKASGAEAVIAQAFKGRETRMIILAALFGGLAPFCSCEVIPFIAGLLALGAPLSAVMAFWLASPLNDPPSMLITAGALGWDFAIGKALLAVAIGLAGGFAIKAGMSFGAFADPVKPQSGGGCGCGPSSFKGTPIWNFWPYKERRSVFFSEAGSNALFLLKWLSLAYVLESLMIAYIPAEAIGAVVGGPGVLPVAVSAVVGVPAYLNAYAAPALVSGLMEQGMSVGAGMAFMVGGAVTSIPAMTAVFALVKRDVFIAYIALGLSGAILAGLAFSVFAQLL
ncbi:MAG: permease [Pseudomonadota bacterium]